MRVEVEQAAVVQEQVVDIHIAGHVHALRARTFDKLERLAAAHLLQMHRHLQEARHFKNPERFHRLGDARDSLHAKRVGETALVHEPVVAERVIERHKEESLARHGTVFHREAQEARTRAVVVAVAEADHAAFGKLHHFGEVLALVAHAERAQEGKRETALRANLLDGGKFQGIVDGIRVAFVKAAVEAATAHGLHTVLEGVDVVAQGFLEIEPEAEERREGDCALRIKFRCPFGCGRGPGPIHEANLRRFSNLPVNKGADVVQDDITHLHDLQPKGKARPFARPRRWSPGSG